jgi:hypothetical protein
VIFKNSVSYRLDEIAEVFRKETGELDQQESLKTLILP